MLADDRLYAALLTELGSQTPPRALPRFDLAARQLPMASKLVSDRTSRKIACHLAS